MKAPFFQGAFLFAPGMEEHKKAIEIGEANTNEKIGGISMNLNEKNENLVVDEAAEKAEPAAEEKVESPKIYSEEEFNTKVNEAAGKRANRREAKIRKEVDTKYGPLLDILKAGTGKETVEEMTEALKDFYEEKGLSISERPTFSDKDIDILGKADAEDIIRAGSEEVAEEMERLSKVKPEKMTARERAMFEHLAKHQKQTETIKKLEELGISKEVAQSEEFQKFSEKFASSTTIEEVVDIFKKTKPKKQFETMGSMKSVSTGKADVKEFYTPEEARKITLEQLQNNPKLAEAIERSMLKW